MQSTDEKMMKVSGGVFSEWVKPFPLWNEIVFLNWLESEPLAENMWLTVLVVFEKLLEKEAGVRCPAHKRSDIFLHRFPASDWAAVGKSASGVCMLLFHPLFRGVVRVVCDSPRKEEKKKKKKRKIKCKKLRHNLWVCVCMFMWWSFDFKPDNHTW